MEENPSPSVEYPQIDSAAVVPTDGKESSENHSSHSETSSSDDVELPSNVTGRKQIFMPLDLRRDDPRIHGKWLWFSNGDIHRQDHIWIQLAKLILQGLVILQESSTVLGCRDRDRYQGVIKCYTRGDVETIKKAGLAIQKIVDDNVILHYKSNKASADNMGRKYGDRFISEYMLTVCGGLYKKDDLERWKKVVDSKLPKCAEPDRHESWSSLTDLGPLPSQEHDKMRYIYPEYGNVQECGGCWSLFCNVGDFDRCGCSEVDRIWLVAKRLVDDGVLNMASCETLAAGVYCRNNSSRRVVHCMLKDYSHLGRLVRPIDLIRKEMEYDFPVYFKLCRLNKGKINFISKYLYSDDRELYEHVDESWQLIERADTLNDLS